MDEHQKVEFLQQFTRELVINTGSTFLFPQHQTKPNLPLIIKPEEKFMPQFPSIPRPEMPRPQAPMPKIPRMEFPSVPATIASISPSPVPMPEGFSLGRLDAILNDKTINNIECQGPNKLLTVKSFGRASLTRMSLAEDEIRGIIDQFSQVARIPVIAGLFKSAVGNLLITAVISDYVGSRFVISIAR
jgi:hypothetical protein